MIIFSDWASWRLDQSGSAAESDLHVFSVANDNA